MPKSRPPARRGISLNRLDEIIRGTRGITADAARAVHADGLQRMPDRYDAIVAERGAGLSVGQKQLLSFARALAFDPQVLIRGDHSGCSSCNTRRRRG